MNISIKKKIYLSFSFLNVKVKKRECKQAETNFYVILSYKC